MKKSFCLAFVCAALLGGGCIRVNGESLSGLRARSKYAVNSGGYKSLGDSAIYKKLEDFSVLVNKTSLDVEVVEGEPGITFSGSKDTFDDLLIVRKGSQLVLGYEKSMRFTGSERIVVSVRNLNELSVASSGSIHASRLSADAVTLRVGGSGSVSVDKVEASSVRFHCGGSGDVIVPALETVTAQLMVIGAGDITINQAEAVNLKAMVQGSGDITLRKLVANNVEATLQGSGDITLRGIETNSLRAVVQGAGDITLQGRAAISTLCVQGTGDINARALKSDRVSQSVQGVGDIHL